MSAQPEVEHLVRARLARALLDNPGDELTIAIAAMVLEMDRTLAGIAADLAEIKGKVEDYEPLVELVKKKADRGSVWRRGRQEGGPDGQ